MIQSLFPTPIGRYNIKRELTEKEWFCVDSLEMKNNVGNRISISQSVLDLKEMKALKAIVYESVNDYFQSVFRPARQATMEITQSWVNVTSKGGFHHIHTHQNSYISGVLYLKASMDKDRICFHRGDYEQLKIYCKEYNEFNSHSWWFEVDKGDIVLFPSRIPHSVEPTETDERVSLSFNTFPVGMLGGHFLSNSLEVMKIGPGNRD